MFCDVRKHALVVHAIEIGRVQHCHNIAADDCSLLGSVTAKVLVIQYLFDDIWGVFGSKRDDLIEILQAALSGHKLGIVQALNIFVSKSRKIDCVTVCRDVCQEGEPKIPMI